MNNKRIKPQWLVMISDKPLLYLYGFAGITSQAFRANTYGSEARARNAFRRAFYSGKGTKAFFQAITAHVGFQRKVRNDYGIDNPEIKLADHITKE